MGAPAQCGGADLLREPPAHGFDSLDPANGFGSDDSIRALGFGLGGGADIEVDASGDVVVIPDAAFRATWPAR